MQELIKVTEENGEQLVSARELHKFLESKQDFTHWIKSRIEKYGFIEDEDFTIILTKSGGRPQSDYILKVDIAKEISMVEGNERGSQARKYFIECEKRLKNQIKVPMTYKEALLELVKAEEEKEKLQLIIAEQKPLVEFADKMLGSKDSLLIRVYSKLLFDEGIKIGEKKLYSWFRENGYLNKNNEPYQQYMEYFEVKVSTYDTPFGTKTNTTTLIKPKGQLYFFKKLKEDKDVI